MLNGEYSPNTDRTDPLSRAGRTLAAKVELALSEARTPSGVSGGSMDREERVVRLAAGLPRVSSGGVLSWMRAQDGLPRSYWSGRDGAFEAASVGVADLIRPGSPGDEPPQERIERMLASSEGAGRARYYGGMRFDDLAEVSEEWRAFGAYRFVLPRLELSVEGGRCELSCNLVLPRDLEKAHEILAGIKGLDPPDAPRHPERPLPEFVGRDDAPDYEGWRENIERSLELFESGELGKVVLARRARHVFQNELDAVSVVESLGEATPGCFHFYFEPEAGVAFLGATPERLYGREGRAVRSEAVAGTRPRGGSSPDDEDLRDELLGSEKDLSEQRFVRDGIVEALGSLCDALTVEEGVSEMKLASWRHLVSRFSGRLSEGAGDGDILAALHPTPAVGGYPREEAKAEIRRVEGFDRGWYAGPVGWISSEGAEFAVGIRSGLARGNELALYSGAGIVSGSTPEGEWAEIEQKIADFIGVLGLEKVGETTSR